MRLEYWRTFSVFADIMAETATIEADKMGHAVGSYTTIEQSLAARNNAGDSAPIGD